MRHERGYNQTAAAKVPARALFGAPSRQPALLVSHAPDAAALPLAASPLAATATPHPRAHSREAEGEVEGEAEGEVEGEGAKPRGLHTLGGSATLARWRRREAQALTWECSSACTCSSASHFHIEVSPAQPPSLQNGCAPAGGWVSSVWAAGGDWCSPWHALGTAAALCLAVLLCSFADPSRSRPRVSRDPRRGKRPTSG